MLATNRSAGVAPEVNLRTSMQTRKHTSEKSTLVWNPGQMSKTGVSVAPQKGLLSYKNLYKKKNFSGYLETELKLVSTGDINYISSWPRIIQRWSSIPRHRGHQSYIGNFPKVDEHEGKGVPKVTQPGSGIRWCFPYTLDSVANLARREGHTPSLRSFREKLVKKYVFGPLRGSHPPPGKSWIFYCG